MSGGGGGNHLPTNLSAPAAGLSEGDQGGALGQAYEGLPNPSCSTRPRCLCSPGLGTTLGLLRTWARVMLWWGPGVPHWSFGGDDCGVVACFWYEVFERCRDPGS